MEEKVNERNKSSSTTSIKCNVKCVLRYCIIKIHLEGNNLSAGTDQCKNAEEYQLPIKIMIGNYETPLMALFHTSRAVLSLCIKVHKRHYQKWFRGLHLKMMTFSKTGLLLADGKEQRRTISTRGYIVVVRRFY